MQDKNRLEYPLKSKYFQISLQEGGDEYIECADEVLIIPQLQDNKIILIEEPAPAFANKSTLLLPGGTVKAGENIEITAQRELMEEIGMKANILTYLGTVTPFSKYLRVRSHVFLGTGLINESLQGDEAHVIGKITLTFSDVEQKISEGEITDARVMAALFLWKNIHR